MTTESHKELTEQRGGLSVDDLLGVDSEAKEDTGLKDIDGKPIFTGDIVEFYFDIFGGYSSDPNSGFTLMRDIVKKIDGVIYFMCAYGGCFAWRAVDYCRVIGDDPALIDT